MNEIYGCDVGNGFSYLTLCSPHTGQPLSMLPAGIRGLNTKIGMPSDAYVTPPEGKPIHVFDPKDGSANQRILRDPERGVRTVKRRFTQSGIPLNGIRTPVSPFEVYGAIARDLVTLGNLQRTADGQPPIYDLILTYPACINQFNNGIELLNRMVESVEQVVIDGHHLHVVHPLPEPAAIGIAYLDFVRSRTQGSAVQELTVLVYDLGHGTFDTSIVTARANGEPYDVWITDGLPDRGGKDFDDALLQYVLDELQSRYDYTPLNKTEQEELRLEVVNMKHELSDHDLASFSHLNRLNASYMEVNVTRSQLEEITNDLLSDTIDCTRRILSRYLNDKSGSGKIDAIVLSGGASRMPMVANRLKSTLQPSCPIDLFRPSEAVSFGAALYAQNAARLHTATSYYVLDEAAGIHGKLTLAIPSGAELPAQSQPLTLHLPSDRQDVRILRPKQEPPADTLHINDCQHLINLHFDLPQEDDYVMTMTVSDDYNITVTLKGQDVTLTASTARRSSD